MMSVVPDFAPTPSTFTRPLIHPPPTHPQGWRGYEHDSREQRGQYNQLTAQHPPPLPRSPLRSQRPRQTRLGNASTARWRRSSRSGRSSSSRSLAWLPLARLCRVRLGMPCSQAGLRAGPGEAEGRTGQGGGSARRPMPTSTATST